MTSILVVEDEANIRKFIRVNLTARGYTILEAASAEEALEILRETSPAAALLDIWLPGMDGWTLLSTIAQDPNIPNVPVIVVTGSMVQDSYKDFAYHNLIDVIAKPIQIKNLLESVQEAIGRAAS